MNKILRMFIFVVPITIVFVICAQMVVANQMIVESARLASLERRIGELELQNDELESRIAQAASVARVSLLARERGFIEPTHYVAFDEHLYSVAFKR